jgi:outer membrane protein
MMKVPPEIQKRINTPLNEQQKQKLLDVIDQSNKTTGAIFEGETHVEVKAPILTALITLNKHFDPFAIDTASQRSVTLKDVIDMALANNLNIKISNADMIMARWTYRGSLGQFLPTIGNTTSFEAMNGKYASPGGIVIPLKNHFLNSANSFSQPLFKGGGILYTALANKHTYKASQLALQGTTYDVLLQATKMYYELALNEVLLQVRIKAVEVSKALVIVQQDMFERGVTTKLDVLQAQYQLSQDRQDLIKQQVARRDAAIRLATALNIDQEMDLTVNTQQLGKITLVDEDLLPADLLTIAINNRPELKKYEELRRAALDEIKVARAALLPTASFVGSVITTAANAQSLSSSSGSNQQTPLASGGNGLTSVSAGGVPLTSSSSSSSSSSSGPHSTGTALFMVALQASWTLGGLGVPEIAQIKVAQTNARKVQLEFNRELNDIRKAVRDAHLSVITAENLIKETTDAFNYAQEGLRVAELRLKDGIGTYLDVIQSQKNYTAALIAKAHAIIDYDTAEASLLHAMGKMQSTNLLSSTPLRK